MATPEAGMDTGVGNFGRMVIFITKYVPKVLQNVLCEELDILYPNLFNKNNGLLYNVLNDKGAKKKLLGFLYKHQLKLLFPNGKRGKPSTSVTVGDLDHLLTVLLLRNITTLEPYPGSTVWDNPSDTDERTEAMIGRITKYRHDFVAHPKKENINITKKDFEKEFSKLKSLLLCLTSRYNLTNEDYDAILSTTLDDDSVKAELEGISEKPKHVIDGQRQMRENLEVITDQCTQAPEGPSDSKKRCLRQEQTTHAVYPPDDLVCDLSKNIGKEWEEVAAYLGVVRPQIDHLKLNFPSDARGQIRNMLIQWREGMETSSNEERRDQLKKALVRVRRNDLADSL